MISLMLKQYPHAFIICPCGSVRCVSNNNVVYDFEEINIVDIISSTEFNATIYLIEAPCGIRGNSIEYWEHC